MSRCNLICCSRYYSSKPMMMVKYFRFFAVIDLLTKFSGVPRHPKQEGRGKGVTSEPPIFNLIELRQQD